jgi:hypothetical protein
MPCRECAVELAGGGDAQETGSGGPVRPGAYGPARGCPQDRDLEVEALRDAGYTPSYSNRKTQRYGGLCETER